MEKNMGVFSRQLSELVSEAVENAFSNGQASVTVKVEGDSVPQKSVPKEPKAGAGWLTAAACGLIPGAICLACMKAKLPVLATSALTVLGGIGGAVLAYQMLRARPAETKPAELPAEPPKVSTEVDDAKASQAKQQKDEDLQKILNYACDYEQSVAGAHDVTLDRKFGEWAQSFLVLTEHSEDRSLLRLRDELLTRLACMKIHVYDELTLNEEGEPDVPNPDYLIDAREGEEYHELVRPLLYSDKGILARGKVR